MNLIIWLAETISPGVMWISPRYFLFWRASAARGHVNGTAFNADQRARLAVWDNDMDEIFANGW